ncbi:Rv3235 family protein [Tessaracoccus sp. Z1128]
MSLQLPVTHLASVRPRHPAPDPVPSQAMNLIRAVLEAVMGRRPLHQLRPHLAPAAFENLVHYVDSGRFRRVRVGRVRSQMPTERSVEATVRVCSGGRSVSCILRLDAGPTTWRCSELVILTPVGVQSAAWAA